MALTQGSIREDSMKKATLGVPFLYLYVIASRLGEEAAILEGI